MPSIITFNFRDFSDEYSSVGLNIPAVDETSWLATDASIATLQAAMLAITSGNLASRTLTAYRETVNDAQPTEPYAQREIGLRFHYTDTVSGKKYFFTVPTADLDVVAEAGTDQVDLEEVTLAAFVAAVEALAISPEGNAIEIYRGVVVGRNS